MKINQLIAKGLSIGFLLNSLSILSYANTEIPNRYQTLEAEYITIDDSMEGNLREIEIFGNTIQDDNNLENIQSVGDLYVDENGNPILDKQGRKQYKIDIITSNNGNILSGEWEMLNFGGAGEVYPNSTYRMTKPIEIHGGKQYTLSFKEGTLDAIGFGFYDKDNNIIKTVVSQKTVTTPINARYIRIRVGTTDSLKYPLDSINEYEVKLEVGDKVSVYKAFNTYRENKTTILLPCQLQKVGDVADRLYWDNEKGRYVIEKNIEKIVIDENMSLKYVRDDNGFSFYNLNIGYSTGNKGDNGRGKIISNWTVNNTITGAGQYYGVETSVTSGGQSDTITVSINTDDLNSVGDISSYMMQNPCVIYHARYDWQVVPPITVYSLKSEIIETNITSKLKIPTYDEKTHIYINSENDINPTLKVTVDRLSQIAKNSVEEAEVDSNLNNIALARMYINMLPESLYKDQLQEQLSEIFSSDMVLDKKTTTANLDLYIKCENILQMSLSTNSITFEDFSGIEDMTKENAVQISINSSLPYSLNAYLPTEIQNSDKSVTMDKDILNIKENSESNYQVFPNTTDKIILKDNCNAGNNLIHGVDIKLKGGIAHEKDVYKTTIKFEAQQK